MLLQKQIRKQCSAKLSQAPCRWSKTWALPLTIQFLNRSSKSWGQRTWIWTGCRIGCMYFHKDVSPTIQWGLVPQFPSAFLSDLLHPSDLGSMGNSSLVLEGKTEVGKKNIPREEGSLTFAAWFPLVYLRIYRSALSFLFYFGVWVWFIRFCRRVFKNADLSFHLAELRFVSVKLSVFVSHSVIQEAIQGAATKPDDIMKIWQNINKLWRRVKWHLMTLGQQQKKVLFNSIFNSIEKIMFDLPPSIKLTRDKMFLVVCDRHVVILECEK